MTEENNTPVKKKAKRRNSKKKEVKPISLSEFKAWLEGLDDALGDNWVPSKDQWKRIREKIEVIKEEQTVMNVQAPSSQPISPTVPMAPPGTTLLTEPAPIMGSTLDMVPPPASPAPSPLKKMAAEPGTAFKTPDIDTRNGKYSSSFE